MRRRRSWLLEAALLVGLVVALCGRAPADSLDDIARALASDPSYRVRAQAAIILGKLKDARARAPLAGALHDESDAVRAVAAGALARLGDVAALDALRDARTDPSAAVRAQVERAIAALEAREKAAPRGGSKVFIELTGISPGDAGADAAKKLRERIALQLGFLPGVTTTATEAAAARRFYVDGHIATLTSSPPDGEGRVRTDCDLRLVVATGPERAIKMMATVGGSTDGTADPRDVAAARDACLADSARQLVARVQSFVESSR